MLTAVVKWWWELECVARHLVKYLECISKSLKSSLWCSKSYYHVHSADEETEAQSLFKVTEVGWTLYAEPVGYLYPEKAHNFSFSASSSLSPWVWASPNLPTKMFPSAFLVSLDSTRLKAPLEKWVSIPPLSFLPPSTFLPGFFPCYHFTSSSPLFSIYTRIRKRKKKYSKVSKKFPECCESKWSPLFLIS